MLSYSRGSGFDSRLGLVAVDQSCQWEDLVRLEKLAGFAMMRNGVDRGNTLGSESSKSYAWNYIGTNTPRNRAKQAKISSWSRHQLPKTWRRHSDPQSQRKKWHQSQSKSEAKKRDYRFLQHVNRKPIRDRRKKSFSHHKTFSQLLSLITVSFPRVVIFLFRFDYSS